MTDNKFEEKFQKAMEGIRKYERKHGYESRINTNFDAYRELISLGRRALPYLKDMFGDEREPQWHVLIAARDIIQDSGTSFKFPKRLAGRLPELEAYVEGFLDREILK